jgi:hypothetical protein
LTARAEAQVLRLSMLYALCDQSAVIDVPHLQAAYALWQYCEASARYIFGESLGDPLADNILQMLRYAGSEGLTRTDISNELGRNVKSAAIGQTLALLRREGFARSEAEKTTRRPIERWLACTHTTHEVYEFNEFNEVIPPEGGPAMLAMPLNSLNSFNSLGAVDDISPQADVGTLPDAMSADATRTPDTHAEDCDCFVCWSGERTEPGTEVTHD